MVQSIEKPFTTLLSIPFCGSSPLPLRDLWLLFLSVHVQAAHSRELCSSPLPFPFLRSYFPREEPLKTMRFVSWQMSHFHRQLNWTAACAPFKHVNKHYCKDVEAIMGMYKTHLYCFSCHEFIHCSKQLLLWQETNRDFCLPAGWWSHKSGHSCYLLLKYYYYSPICIPFFLQWALMYWIPDEKLHRHIFHV